MQLHKYNLGDRVIKPNGEVDSINSIIIHADFYVKKPPAVRYIVGRGDGLVTIHEDGIKLAGPAKPSGPTLEQLVDGNSVNLLRAFDRIVALEKAVKELEASKAAPCPTCEKYLADLRRKRAERERIQAEDLRRTFKVGARTGIDLNRRFTPEELARFKALRDTMDRLYFEILCRR